MDLEKETKVIKKMQREAQKERQEGKEMRAGSYSEAKLSAEEDEQSVELAQRKIQARKTTTMTNPYLKQTRKVEVKNVERESGNVLNKDEETAKPVQEVVWQSDEEKATSSKNNRSEGGKAKGRRLTKIEETRDIDSEEESVETILQSNI